MSATRVILVGITVIATTCTVSCSGCEDESWSHDAGGRDATSDAGGGVEDVGGVSDASDGGEVVDVTDASEPQRDTGSARDTGDAADTAVEDAGEDTGRDAGGDAGDAGDASDAGDAGDETDAADASVVPPTGLSTPCQNGPGWTLFRVHYDDGSTSARVDVWDATCEYSFAPNSACNVQEVTYGFGDVPRNYQGYPILDHQDYIRVRFKVTGLQFTGATLHLEAAGPYTIASTEYRAWSPLYGERIGGPIDRIMDWSTLDWTGMLTPYDEHGLTAIEINAVQSPHTVTVRSIELCVE